MRLVLWGRIYKPTLGGTKEVEFGEKGAAPAIAGAGSPRISRTLKSKPLSSSDAPIVSLLQPPFAGKGEMVLILEYLCFRYKGLCNILKTFFFFFTVV